MAGVPSDKINDDKLQDLKDALSVALITLELAHLVHIGLYQKDALLSSLTDEHGADLFLDLHKLSYTLELVSLDDLGQEFIGCLLNSSLLFNKDLHASHQCHIVFLL